MMRTPVLILAGSRDGERDPLAQYGNVSHKALLPIQEMPMIERVVRTLEQTHQIGPIWVSIEKPELLQFLGNRIKLLKASASPSESVEAAIKKIGLPCLVTTADHALLEPSWVNEFLHKSRLTNADLTAGVAFSNVIERDVPTTKRTYITLSDGKISGCNLFWLGTMHSAHVITLWKNLQQNRKKPLRMAFTLGIGTIIRALTKTLSTYNIEKRIGKITQTRVKLIPMSQGCAAVDVDKVADYHLVNTLLSK